MSFLTAYEEACAALNVEPRAAVVTAARDAESSSVPFEMVVLNGNDRHLFNSRLRDNDAKALCDAIRVAKQPVKRLDLSYNLLGDSDDGVEKFSKF